MNSNETLLSHDRLALFGFGLFETLLITQKGPLFGDLHWQRMNRGANFLGLKMPEKNDWLKRVQEALDPTPNSFPYALRVTLSGGSPQANLPSQLFFQTRVFHYTSEHYALGMKLNLLPFPRNERSPLVSLKSTNYLENILAKEIAQFKGAEEGIWLNTKGYLAEGTMSNLFFIENGTLFTPSLASGCLPGTRRQIILDLARSLHIPSFEGLYPLSKLISADEVFMTNALMGIMPVCQIDDLSFPVANPQSTGSVRRILDLAFQELVANTFKPLEPCW